jgi:hypothetical protein
MDSNASLIPSAASAGFRVVEVPVSYYRYRFLSPTSSTNSTNAREYVPSRDQPLADAVAYLTEAEHVTGEVLHVDDGAHVGKW